MCVSPQRRAIFRHQNFKKWSETVSFLTFSLANVRFATAACNFSTSELQKVLRDRQFFNIFTCKCAFRHTACNFSTSELQKVVRDRQFFNIFTCKCAFRHSGVQFFDIRTSKSAPRPSVFLHFHLQMRVSPQRRAIFRHHNFKKWSETVSFLTFSLANVRFATAACNFRTSQLLKVVRS